MRRKRYFSIETTDDGAIVTRCNVPHRPGRWIRVPLDRFKSATELKATALDPSPRSRDYSAFLQEQAELLGQKPEARGTEQEMEVRAA